MRLMPMQEDRHRDDGDVRQPKRNQHQSPPRQIDKTCCEHSVFLPYKVADSTASRPGSLLRRNMAKAASLIDFVYYESPIIDRTPGRLQNSWPRPIAGATMYRVHWH